MKDVNRVPLLLDRLEELEKKSLEFGIFGEDDSEVLMIARVNEFGVQIEVTERMRGYLHSIGIHLRADTEHINIPERSFVRGYFDFNQRDIITNAEKLLENVILLKISVNTFYSTLGEYIVGKMKSYLTRLREPSNHPKTIEQKGSSNPLIDTGRLRDSITYKVVKN